MNAWLKQTLLRALVVGTITASVSLIVLGVYSIQQNAEKNHNLVMQNIFDQGRQSKLSSVPANANPYLGSQKTWGQEYSVQWLNGWASVKEKQEVEAF